jgi:hypothetical protein
LAKICDFLGRGLKEEDLIVNLLFLVSVRLRRLTDKDFPLVAMMGWEPSRIRNYRVVLQENETGEIVVSMKDYY